MWQGNQNETTDSFVGTPYLGDLPLINTSHQLAQLDFPAKQSVLSELVSQLIERKLVAVNVVTEKILLNLDVIHTVTDMAAIAQISSRQLQRILKSSTGFSPHDLLKVLRLQQSFKQHYLESYAINHTLFIRFEKSQDTHPQNITVNLMSDLYNT